MLCFRAVLALLNWIDSCQAVVDLSNLNLTERKDAALCVVLRVWLSICKTDC